MRRSGESWRRLGPHRETTGSSVPLCGPTILSLTLVGPGIPTRRLLLLPLPRRRLGGRFLRRFRRPGRGLRRHRGLAGRAGPLILLVQLLVLRLLPLRQRGRRFAGWWLGELLPVAG